ncbi:MAG: hypothetical protein ACI9TV_001690 [Sulfurimonas sp.]|jgi:hypothetical protein|uniref:porin n=1 Tax=Sulfurimonas sp. TaxID=2022749 RepID=UPI0039E4B7A7
MNSKKITLSLLTALTLTSTAFANDKSEIAQLKQEMSELKEITQSLIDETSDLKSGFNYTTVDPTKSHSGLASAASKVYYSKSPLSIGGYGEMYFASQEGDSTDKRTLDVYRFVPYIGYKFTDNIILNTEIEFEHGGVDAKGNGGEVIMEFMYLDFLMDKKYNLRVGHMLMPMGLINERHEPTLFTTVQRPNTSKNIIPSTWHESGVMVYGEITEGLSYNFAATSALETGVNGSKWLRDGRGGSYKQTDPSLGFTARLDYTGTNGLLLGTSAYYAPSESTTKSATTITDVHVDYKVAGARVYGTYAIVNRSQAGNIATNAVDKAYGGYLNLSYDLLSSSSTGSLPVFVQYEDMNAEDSRADGTSGDATKTTTLGINYFPHEQVVLKLDYAMQSKGSTDDNIASVSMGFIF